MAKRIPAAASAWAEYVDGWERQFRPKRTPGEKLRADGEEELAVPADCRLEPCQSLNFLDPEVRISRIILAFSPPVKGPYGYGG